MIMGLFTVDKTMFIFEQFYLEQFIRCVKLRRPMTEIMKWSGKSEMVLFVEFIVLVALTSIDNSHDSRKFNRMKLLSFNILRRF